ncbi:MAG: hypothetical protein ACTSRS_12480 [Candidatus Helarchaeota archaeon]
MVQSETKIPEDASNPLLKLAQRMANYITFFSPSEKQQVELQKFLTERAKYDELDTKYQLTLQELQHKEQQIQQFKTQIETLQLKIRGLEDSLNAISESKSVSKLNTELQTELKAKNASINELTKELDSIQSVHNALLEKVQTATHFENEIVKLKNQLNGEWRKNQELRRILQQERQSIKNLEAEKEGLEYALRRLERRLLQKGTLRGLAIPIQQLDISEDIIGKADAEIQEQIRNMKLELQKRLDRIKELEIRNQGLKEKLAKSSTRDLQLEVERLKSELEARNGKIMGLESKHKKLLNQIETFQQRMGDLQNKIMLQGKELEEKDKIIKNLETAVSTGVRDEQARGVIQNLQLQNRDLRNQVRDSEKIIRSLEKNIKFLQTQLKQQKEQSYKLYTQNRDQIILIQKLQTALQQGGSVASIDIPIIDQKAILSDEGPSLDDEIKTRDRKIARLESYVESLKQEVEDLQFRMTSRDIKIDELTNILNEMKADLANSKIKIIIRPPSTDKYRQAKVKF